MNDEVYIDVPAVTGMADTLQTISETLDAVVKMLDMLLNTLKMTAFIGLVGGTVVIVFIETIKPLIEQTAQKTGEMSRDVHTSVKAYVNGDDQGSTKFH